MLSLTHITKRLISHWAPHLVLLSLSLLPVLDHVDVNRAQDPE